MKKKELDMNRKKNSTETNASATTIGYSRQYGSSVDNCIRFCLEKARDDKSNTDMYLNIIKYLLDKSPVEWHYHQQPYWPNITYTNDKNPDWQINKVYCDSNPDVSESGFTCGAKMEMTNE